MESKKINQLATELTPSLSDLTIIGDPTTGISKKITLSQMASLFTGTVEEYANVAAFPLVGTADTIYIALDTNVLYRWNGTAYVELSPNIVSSLVFNDANGFDGTITLVGSVATLTITTALTLGSLPFIGASGALTQDNANLFYDDTNNRLGIGTNLPTTPLDVFGSGIIARVNGTSTNNAFLGFGSAGTNRWSVGNVQSDHRFRIFSEPNSSELVSILQTGEFGIGIANPTTKLHLDGGATALIANLDANVSVAKSISFRSDNSNRINLEVSGTESGSNAGANFFIRRYSDLGALIDTPFTITRSTGLITLATALSGLSASFSGDLTVDTNTLYVDSANNRVGIGTTSPVGKFSINDVDNTVMLSFLAAGNGRLNIGTTSAAQAYIRSQNSVSLRLGVDTSDYLNILSSGLIGIGTASPASLLDVKQPTLAIGSIFQAWAPGVSGANFRVVSTSSQPFMQYDFFNGNLSVGGKVFASPSVGNNAYTATVSGSAIAYLTSLASTSDFSGYWQVAGNFAGSISHPTNTSTNYNTTSDYRLKENIKPLSNGLESILKLKPVTGNYKSDPNKTNMPMFLAHEVQEVVPIAVTGEKDAVKFNKQTGKEDIDIQQLDASKLIPHMVKAIQELKAEIDLLKGINPIEPIEEVEPILPIEPINESEPKAEPTQPEADSDTNTTQ